MKKRPARASVSQKDRSVLLVGFIASGVSLCALLYYFQRGQILLYGDAVAHINIARRIFDSRTPGLLQLGTVWLPLPHLLMAPFIVAQSMWQSGIGGSIPSMISYVLAVVGVFRFTRNLLNRDERTKVTAQASAWIAALVFAANPNLIYLQSTAMTETMYLALFVWAIVFFSEFVGSTDEIRSFSRSKLLPCALCVAGAELTRYDGWFLAAVLGAIVAVMMLTRWNEASFRTDSLKFLAAIALMPILWLAYNGVAYRNPLEFANGPYSAKAIERRTSTPGSPPHPGTDNVVVSASFFLKAGQLNMATRNWGRIWIALTLAGLVWMIARRRQRGVLLLLAVPIIFYALSVAYSGVPIFLPTWWPFTWYNLRYGLQLLPLFSVCAGIAVPMLLDAFAVSQNRARHNTKSAGLQFAATCTVVVGVAISYTSVWKSQPLCFKEAWVNSRTKLALESAVARNLKYMPRDSTYLMYLGEHVGVFQQDGIPLKQVINEGNHRPWMKPQDPGGLWERALADPAHYVDVVVAYEGDDVDRQVNKVGLTLVSEVHTTGQARARIYLTRALNQSR